MPFNVGGEIWSGAMNDTLSLESGICKRGLWVYLDAGRKDSYPGSGTTWYDISGGTARNGTLVNGPTFSSVNGGAIVTDGSNDYVQISHSTGFGYSATTDWAVSMWYSVLGTNSGFTWSKRDGGSDFMDAQHSNGNSTQYWGLNSSGGSSSDSLSSVGGVITVGGIYNVTWVHIGTMNRLEMYVNGIFNNSSIMDDNSGNYGDSAIFLGKIINQEYANENIHIFMGYDRLLSASDILRNFNAQRSRFGK